MRSDVLLTGRHVLAALAVDPKLTRSGDVMLEAEFLVLDSTSIPAGAIRVHGWVIHRSDRMFEVERYRDFVRALAAGWGIDLSELDRYTSPLEDLEKYVEFTVPLQLRERRHVVACEVWERTEYARGTMIPRRGGPPGPLVHTWTAVKHDDASVSAAIAALSPEHHDREFCRWEQAALVNAACGDQEYADKCMHVAARVSTVRPRSAA